MTIAEVGINIIVENFQFWIGVSKLRMGLDFDLLGDFDFFGFFLEFGGIFQLRVGGFEFGAHIFESIVKNSINFCLLKMVENLNMSFLSFGSDLRNCGFRWK